MGLYVFDKLKSGLSACILTFRSIYLDCRFLVAICLCLGLSHCGNWGKFYQKLSNFIIVLAIGSTPGSICSVGAPNPVRPMRGGFGCSFKPSSALLGPKRSRLCQKILLIGCWIDCFNKYKSCFNQGLYKSFNENWKSWDSPSKSQARKRRSCERKPKDQGDGCRHNWWACAQFAVEEAAEEKSLRNFRASATS